MASHSKIRLFLAQQGNKDALVVDKLTNNKLSVARNSRNRNSRPQPNVGLVCYAHSQRVQGDKAECFRWTA